MKEIKIRDYIIHNFQDDDVNTLRNTITECILDGDEETLPGMGVFMELIWKKAPEELKKSIQSLKDDNKQVMEELSLIKAQNANDLFLKDNEIFKYKSQAKKYRIMLEEKGLIKK